MIRAIEIQKKLAHLIGWQRSFDSTDTLISTGLSESESGLYFQQVHPLLTLANMACIAPDFKNLVFPTYTANENSPFSADFNLDFDNGKKYEVDAIVRYTCEGEDTPRYYKAIAASAGMQPDISPSYWMETTPFSEWLEDKTKASIYKAIVKFITDKVNKGTYRNLFENKTLFDGTGRIVDVVKNKKNVVGFEIVPIRAKGVTTKINRIGLQFTKTGDYEVYIMHSSCNDPVYKYTFTRTKENSIEWFKLTDCYLPYENEEIEPGGSWYIVYFQSDLPEGSQAIRKERDWSKGPCKLCSRREFEAWSAWSKYLEVHPFYVNEEIVPTEVDDELNKSIHLWDVEDNVYTYDNNYGINLDVTVSCDITDFIIEQRSMFVDIIAKQVAIDMLREFAYNANVRTNRHSINASRVDILYEIDGDSGSMKKTGLSAQLEEAYKALELSTEGLDRVCLPCINHGIKYRTV